ncbi:DUF1028 domain-containing protein [Celeribacter sp.]|uniref:DUF1028 domain-containing protein n=1 Tax=Celeribacter sp. TaxID=1890673 RepID=UPI003A8DDC65
MTFSILVRDAKTGAIGGAATTGSLCVGGWVLRGDLRAGMSASQGASPSTFWGEDTLTAMKNGASAQEALAGVIDPDTGREDRQLAALDLHGGTAHFTGSGNTGAAGGIAFENGVVAGNILASLNVLSAVRDGFAVAEGTIESRLIAALRAGAAAGSDTRGLQSAALLVLRPNTAPITLRIDYHDSDPIGALEALYARATSGDYAHWARQVPSLNDPYRGLDQS